MPDSSPFLPAVENIAHGSAIENLGVIRCCSAAHKTFLAAVADGKPNDIAHAEAAEAYRRAMPPLDSAQNISNFISCVAHAMLIRVIEPAEAPRLLYAAQCAVAPLRKPSSRPQGE